MLTVQSEAVSRPTLAEGPGKLISLVDRLRGGLRQLDPTICTQQAILYTVMQTKSKRVPPPADSRVEVAFSCA